MEKIEIYKILTLEDDKDYQVVNLLDYKDNTYLYLVEVDENEEPIMDNQMIVRYVLKDGEEATEQIEDEEEAKEVSGLFFELFQELLEEENKDVLESSEEDNE